MGYAKSSSIDDRLQRQHKSILRLTAGGRSVHHPLEEFTEESARTLDVDQVSVWLLNNDNSSIRCLDLFQLPGAVHQSGMELAAADYPDYFAAITKGEVIDASDAHTDPRTKELAPGYLIPNEIGAMLDIAFSVGGHVAGVVCHETRGKSRPWNDDEISYAVTITEMIAHKLDQEERQQAEERLKQAKETAEKATLLKDKFVSMVAHDLKSPFNSILGLLRLVEEDADHALHPRHAQIIRRVIGSGDGLVQMIDDLLNLSTLQTGSVHLNRRFHDLSVLLSVVLDNLGALAEQKGIIINNEMSTGTRIYADSLLFSAVLQNLVSNAIKFLSSGETITISCEIDRHVSVTVSDSGPGINKQILTNLFKSDVKTSTRGTSGEKGTGLGLPYCSEIMEAHDGLLTVQSFMGKGSAFCASLPVRKPTILLVDDETLICKRLKEVLGHLDVTFLEARNGVDALTTIQENEVDLVVLDLIMPEMDGFEFLRSLRRIEAFAELPVIVLTGDNKIESRDRAFSLGANDFINKTIVLEDVIPRIKRFVQ